MPALVELVGMDEVGIGILCPTPWHLIELVRKDAHRYRNGDALRVKESDRIFPIETPKRDPRVRQPVMGDVVEHIVSGKALVWVPETMYTGPDLLLRRRSATGMIRRWRSA